MLIMFNHISFWNHCVACFFLSFCLQSHFALPLFGSIQLTLCSMLSSKQQIASPFLTIGSQQIWVDGDISWNFRIPGDIKVYQVTKPGDGFNLRRMLWCPVASSRPGHNRGVGHRSCPTSPRHQHCPTYLPIPPPPPSPPPPPPSTWVNILLDWLPLQY